MQLIKNTFLCSLYWPLSLGILMGTEPLQIVVVTAPDANSHQGQLRLFQRDDPAAAWHPMGGFSPAQLGRNGLAWGMGLHPAQPGLQKRERDRRSPSGIFKIGLVLGSSPGLPVGSKWTEYHQITLNDAWPDDPSVPEYNHLFTLKTGQPMPSWFVKSRMKQNDPAYRWLVLIEHNYPDSIPGLGSAIFLHTRRSEDTPSAGCTVMEGMVLEKLITWLDPIAQPEFVLLCSADYLRLWKNWKLPPPEMALPSTKVK